MHKAPAVNYPVGRSIFQVIVLVATLSFLTTVDALWFMQAQRIDWRHWIGLATSVSAALAGYLSWRFTQMGVLSWDGRSWWWESNGLRVGGVLVPCLDFQVVLLLKFHAQSGTRYWLWLEKESARSHWLELRRAVHVPGQGDHDAGTPVLALNLPLQKGTTEP